MLEDLILIETLLIWMLEQVLAKSEKRFRMDFKNNNSTEEDNSPSLMVELNKLVEKDNLTRIDVLHMYDKFAEDYEEQMKEINFKAAYLAVKYFNKHAQRFNVKNRCAILDVGAGTGTVGDLLRHTYGCTVVDALDPSSAMLAKAREKRVYRNIYLGGVGGGEKIPVDVDTYDGVITAGCLLPGHIPVDAMLEIIRVVKPGGIVVNVMRDEFTWSSEQCDVRHAFAQWQLDDKWDIIEWTVPESKYFCNKDALVHVYRISSRKQTK